jgi:hypothetical protein
MKNQLLRTQPDGELGKPVSVVLGIVSLTVCFSAWLLVWLALPREASLAQLALPVLLVGAVPGLFQIFTLAVKIYQGGQAQVERKR